MRIALKILFMIPVLYVVAMPVYFAITVNKQACSGIEVNIRDSSDYHFVTRKNIMNVMYTRGGRMAGKPLKEIKVSELESGLKELRELKHAEVYPSIEGKLIVYADQRDPVLRVMPQGGGDFFMDEEGVVFRKRNLYNPRLHIVSGNISISQAMLNGTSVFDTRRKRGVYN